MEGNNAGSKKLSVFNWIIIIAALAFLGWFLYGKFAPGSGTTATIKTGTVGTKYKGTCLIVRYETPYEADGVTRVDYSAAEGSMLQARSTICSVYSSGYNNREMATLQEDRDQIRDYQESLLQSDTTYDAKMSRLESDVLQRARELRNIISGERGNLENQEVLLSAAIDSRQMYLKKKFANDQRMSRLLDDEHSQQQRIDSWTKKYESSGNYIVSFYSDGYEYFLNGNNYDSFTPAEVQGMIKGIKPERDAASKTKTTIYRTVTDGTWYVLLLIDGTNWNPIVGQTYDLSLEHAQATQVKAVVTSSVRQGGQLLVRLMVNSSVSPVLYMRTCQAEIGDYVPTLMVPERALYTNSNGITGVVVEAGLTEAGLVPVNVIWRDNGYAYIQSVTQGLLYEGQTVKLY